MNRRYTVAQYLDIIDRVRVKIPSIAIGTDVIVGFCGETLEQFERTVELYERVRFDICYTARYSQRSGTVASRAFKDDVSETEKRRRWNVLQEVQERITHENNQKYFGTQVSVLVERCENGTCFGNSREMKLVRFPSVENLVGKIVDVKIIKVGTWVMDGECV
jgi:tRNA-2-methylthio-N6-dimethylallyladenosine synthase